LQKNRLINKEVAMLRKEAKNSIIEICPVRNVVARFGNKWSLLVVLVLSEHGTLRFTDLRKLIPDISSRMLSSTLHTLESDALVQRTAYPTVPPRVEYNLTEIGQSLVPLILQLTEWAQANMKQIIEHRNHFEVEMPD
jgi:DNA-binding HxlR family transcriptional regulator